MTNVRFYTNSEIETYKRCKRKWFLGYVMRYAKPPKLWGARQRGSLSHSSLDLYYSTGDDPLDFIRSEQVRLRQEYLGSMMEFEEGMAEEGVREIDKMCDLVLAMVEGYIEHVTTEGLDLDYELIETEQERSVSLDKYVPGTALLGKLDAKFRRLSDGFRVFFDHKTVGDLTQFPRWAHMSPQMLMYEMIEYLLLNEDDEEGLVDAGVYNMLRTVKRTARAKPPFYDRYEVRHNIHQLRSFFRQTVALIQEMERVRVTVSPDNHQSLCPPTPSQDCTWSCDFFSVCSLTDDGGDWQGLLDEAYQQQDPLARYTFVEKG